MNEIIFFYPSFEKGGATKILIKIINFFNKKNIKVILITSKIYKNLSHAHTPRTATKQPSAEGPRPPNGPRGKTRPTTRSSSFLVLELKFLVLGFGRDHLFLKI